MLTIEKKAEDQEGYNQKMKEGDVASYKNVLLLCSEGL